MRRSGRVVFLSAFSLLVLTLHSCSDDDIKETYPSIVSEFSDIYSNDKGTLYQFVTDSQKKFLISNTLTGYAASRIYRGVCGYVANGERATLYQLQAAYVLRDSTATPRRDPTAVLSVWSTDRYINMQLQPRTQGGRQYWGYCTDSIRTKHIFLSLYHNQNADPTSYSEMTYASILLDSIPNRQPEDTITLSIRTFGGTETWHFPPSN